MTGAIRQAQPYPWCEKTEGLIRRLWLSGASASQIATALMQFNPGVDAPSRNAVIGKIHRMGLTGRKTPCRVIKPPKRRLVTKPKPGSAQPIPMAKRTFPWRVKFLERTAVQCPFPLPGESGAEMMVCGARVADGSPYCADCHALAYIRQQPRQTAAQLAGKAAAA